MTTTTKTAAVVPYAAMLVAPEAGEHSTRVYLDPTDAMKLVKRIRKVSFFLNIAMPMLTNFSESGEPSRGFHIEESLKVSAEQVYSILEKKDRFAARKIANGEEAGKVEVCRHGDCLFFG